MDILEMEYSIDTAYEIQDAFAAMDEATKKETFRALVLKTFQEDYDENRKSGLSIETARKEALRTAGQNWAINLNCEDAYCKVYRPYLLATAPVPEP